MSNIRGVSVTAIVNEIDEGVLDAVRVIRDVVKNDNSRLSDRMSAANSLIKIKIQMAAMQRQQIYDRIDLKMKQINLATAEIKLIALEKIADPKATPKDIEVHSRALTPDMRPYGISDKVSKEKL